MQTAMNEADPGRNFAQRILDELRAIRSDLDILNKDVGTLTECVGLLLRPADEEDQSPLQAMMKCLGLLVSGTDETHKRLESLQATVTDPRLTSALRAAILD